MYPASSGRSPQNFLSLHWRVIVPTIPSPPFTTYTSPRTILSLMVWRKAGLGRHWLSRPFDDNHREASSRISRTESRSPCCARVILTSDPTSTKWLALSSTVNLVRFGRYQHLDRHVERIPDGPVCRESD